MSTSTIRQQLWQRMVSAQSALESAEQCGDARAWDDARLLFEVASGQLARHLAARIGAPAVHAMAAPEEINAHLYPYPGHDEIQAQSGGRFPQPVVGVCLSGGGSRAASASMGALRALRYLGLLDKITFLSTVSGGGWAGVPYTYCPDAIGDETLLGPMVLDPARLSWRCTGDPDTALDILDAHALGSLCTRVGITELLEQVVALKLDGTPTDALWNRAIGKLVLEPFGLGDHLANGAPTRSFSYTPWWRDNVVLKNNPGLRANDFYIVQMSKGRAHRPYLITNSTVFYPPSADDASAIRGRSMAKSTVADPYPFEGAPMVAGIPPSFPRAGRDGRDLGGGFIDPFAFGSQAPVKPPLSHAVTVRAAAAPFALSDIAGASSSAYVDVLISNYSSSYPWIQALDPTFGYWPVLDAGTPSNSAAPYLFGDGGIMENTGIMALLRRQAPSILAVLNCSQKLTVDRHGVIVVDDMLPPLFGYLPYRSSSDSARNGYRPLAADPMSLYRYNQVFDSSAFEPLIAQLWQAASAGASAVVKQSQLTVRQNTRFGIQGGAVVDVLWIYNNPVAAWRARLREEVRIAMDLDPPRFGSFPNYATISQLNLDARQVNLLAHLSSWNVASDDPISGRPTNRSLVESMFE